MAKRHGSRIGGFEAVFTRLEELVLANSGADEFDEVFKLLVAKLWDEQRYRGERFRIYETGARTFESIVALLREAGKHWVGIIDSLAEPTLTPEHLEICVEALARHSISGSNFEVMDSFFEFMVSRNAKSAKGQYFTPRYVVEFCVRMLSPNKEETIVDPACGSGGFLIQSMNYVREHEHLNPSEFHTYCADKLFGFDIDARAGRVAKALMVLAGDANGNIFRLNSLMKPGAQSLFQESNGSSLTIEDVCRTKIKKHKGFDIVLTNPPFAGEVREQHIMNGYETSRGKSRIERDVLFMERCLNILRPGGRMAIILPHNKFAAESYMDVRKWLLRHSRVLAVVGLGRHTFLPHTHQKASILFLQKKRIGEELSRNSKIFFAISEKDGKDSKGQLLQRPSIPGDATAWIRVEHDLEEILGAFGSFCQSEAIRLGEP